MKKFYTVLALILMAVVFTSCALADQPQTPNDESEKNVSASGKIDNESANAAAVSEAEAKQAALTHANVDEKDARFLKVEMEKENGVTVYEIEFLVGDKEYDYEIDASNGKVLACDFEVETQKPANDSSESARQITDELAKAIALAHAKLNEADVKIIRIRLEYDDGKPEFEVDFYHGDTEYEYEIDAVSGEIISSDVEKKPAANDTANQNTQKPADENKTEYIGEAAAKAKAFSHAGVKESDAKKVEVELDREGKRWVYEVEFDVGRVEYSYEIDAVTGAIIEHEIDRD